LIYYVRPLYLTNKTTSDMINVNGLDKSIDMLRDVFNDLTGVIQGEINKGNNKNVEDLNEVLKKVIDAIYDLEKSAGIR
jgi:hypothetical protein